jgi:hypothetical protein
MRKVGVGVALALLLVAALFRSPLSSRAKGSAGPVTARSESPPAVAACAEESPAPRQDRSEIVRSRLSGFDAAQFQPGAVLDLKLFEDLTLRVALGEGRPAASASGNTVWRATVDGADPIWATAAFVTEPDGALAMGEIQMPGGRIVRIRRVRDGSHEYAIHEIDPSRLPLEGCEAAVVTHESGRK